MNAYGALEVNAGRSPKVCLDIHRQIGVTKFRMRLNRLP